MKSAAILLLVSLAYLCGRAQTDFALGAVAVNGNSLSAFQEVDIEPVERQRDRPILSIGYVGIKRHRLAGNIGLDLPTHFVFIQLGSGYRFSPDEPSSFCYLSYKLPDSWEKFDLSLGLFRNHTKGDFLYDNGDMVHFGMGNSQLAIGASAEYAIARFKNFSGSVQLFLGIGPQFTRFETEGYSGKWGIKGFGEVAMLGANLTTPLILKRLSFTGSLVSVMHHASFAAFEITEESTGKVREYSKRWFLTVSGVTPTIRVNLDIGPRTRKVASSAAPSPGK